MSGFGGVVSLEIQGDLAKTGRFVDLLRLPYIGPTLGGVESIVQQQARFVSVDPPRSGRIQGSATTWYGTLWGSRIPMISLPTSLKH